jgi:hypothetical protein
VTHLYVILVGGTVVRGGDAQDATALAWAGDTVLAIGTDEEVRAVSRGDSTVVDLRGATVLPLHAGEPAWPTDGCLDVGLPASFAIVTDDPRIGSRASELLVSAVVIAGTVVNGAVPGTASAPHPHEPIA